MTLLKTHCLPAREVSMALARCPPRFARGRALCAGARAAPEWATDDTFLNVAAVASFGATTLLSGLLNAAWECRVRGAGRRRGGERDDFLIRLLRGEGLTGRVLIYGLVPPSSSAYYERKA